MGETWTLSSCTFRTCDFLAFVLLIPHVKGAPRGGWVTAHRPWGPCLGSVSWDSSQPLQQPRLMCWRCFHVRGPCPAGPRDPPWLQILESLKGPLGFFTHLLSQPSDLVSWDWAFPAQLVLGSLLLSEPTAPSRQSWSFSAVPGLTHSLSFPYTFPSLIPHNFPSLSAKLAATKCLWRTLVTLFWLNETGSVFLCPL